jgi:hypothetical protein
MLGNNAASRSRAITPPALSAGILREVFARQLRAARGVRAASEMIAHRVGQHLHVPNIAWRLGVQGAHIGPLGLPHALRPVSFDAVEDEALPLWITELPPRLTVYASLDGHPV